MSHRQLKLRLWTLDMQGPLRGRWGGGGNTRKKERKRASESVPGGSDRRSLGLCGICEVYNRYKVRQMREAVKNEWPGCKTSSRSGSSQKPRILSC